MSKTQREILVLTLIKVLSFFSVAFLLIILTYIFYKGIKVINFSFLFSYPKNGFTEGGIFPSIVGTMYLVIVTMILSVPVGVLGGIYLSEYAKDDALTRFVLTSIGVLSGVPSIVFGLFGLAIFVKKMHLGVSILSGGLTLAILVLPTIIQSTIDGMKNIPKDFKDASYGIGATKWQTTWQIVLKAAFPNILTGIILSIGRAAGEAAPILFTAATFYMRGLPNSIFDKTMALPYIVYGLVTEGTFPDKQVPIAYGASVVLLLVVLLISLIGIIIRARIRSRRKW
ncbi:MAG: phosphate ABC transporter permease PstA [Caldisericaceae bacterium]